MPEFSDDEKNLVFHYSRDQRLRRADDRVRDLNDPRPRRRPGLFRTLTATRSGAFLLLAIVMLALTATVTTFLLPSENAADLAGNALSLSAFRFQGSTYVALKKTAKAKAYTGPVELVVSPVPEDGSAPKPESIVFSLKKEEEFRFAVPGEAARVLAVIQIQDKRRTLKAKVE